MSKRLDAMRHNPQSDWKIADVEALCKEFSVNCSPHRGGSSHYKVSHASQIEILTIPFKRTIKVVYIRNLVRFIDAVRNLQ